MSSSVQSGTPITNDLFSQALQHALQASGQPSLQVSVSLFLQLHRVLSVAGWVCPPLPLSCCGRTLRAITRERFLQRDLSKGLGRSVIRGACGQTWSFGSLFAPLVRCL